MKEPNHKRCIFAACLVAALSMLIACSPKKSPAPVPETLRDTASVTTPATESDGETDSRLPLVTTSPDTEHDSEKDTAEDFLVPDETLAETSGKTDGETVGETVHETVGEEDRRGVLPMEGNRYILGDPHSKTLAAVGYVLFQETHRDYVGYSFILYGLYEITDGIQSLSFGQGMSLPILFADDEPIPTEGSFVKMQAVYTAEAEAHDQPYAAIMLVSSTEVISMPEDTGQSLRYVTAEVVFVHAQPDSGAETVGMLYKGDAVRLLADSCGDTGEWCMIALESDAGYGYVKAAYLTENPET